MTNNPTIDGVSRELLNQIYFELYAGTPSIATLAAIRALLDREVITDDHLRQRIAFLTSEIHAQSDANAALQSTIAQLQAENSRVNDACHDMKRELDLAKARIGELESGICEPVAWMCFDGEGNYDFTEDPETAEAWRKSNGEQYADWLTPLFTAPPAPVAVVMPERREPAQDNPYLTDADHEWNACLDANAALNGPAK